MNESILKSKIVDLRKELIKLNAQVSTGTTPENPGRLKLIKKTIARINTKLTLLKNQPKDNTKEKKEIKKQTNVKKPKTKRRSEKK